MSERIWYFAYGSNMKESRLLAREVKTFRHQVGYITDYAFRYNKIGIDGTGKGNIIKERGSMVRGVFFEILLEDYRHLHEKFEKGYRQIEVKGISGQEIIRAKSFMALPENMDDKMIPSPKYHDTIIAGAREKGLPEAYIEIIKNRRKVMSN